MAGIEGEVKHGESYANYYPRKGDIGLRLLLLLLLFLHG